jgi:multiple sugar transport system substrate-binding protein
MTSMALAAAVALAGCGANGQGETKTAAEQANPAKEPVVSNAPVTLKLYAHVEAFEESAFKMYIEEFVKKKYPNITLEFSSGGRGNIEKLIAANAVPDIIFSGSDNYMSLKDLNIPYDMEGLLKENQFDLSAFTPGSLDTIRKVSDGKLTAVPFGHNGAATFYNKDIFDKFGVPYPTNGMTYDDIISLARKLTRVQDGVQYVGWEPGFPDATASPFVQPLADNATNKARIDTPHYKKIFDMMKTAYEIPGLVGPNGLFRYAPKAFVEDHTVAIFVDWYNKMMLQFLAADKAGKAPNWDLVTVPNFPENANKGRHESVQFMLVTNQSSYKAQAVQVIKAATSLEAQLAQSRNGRMAVLKDPEIEKQFAKDVKAFQGKQLENLFKFKASPSTTKTIYDDEMVTIIRNIAKEIAVNKKDVNTAIREAQELADKKVAEMAAAKK